LTEHITYDGLRQVVFDAIAQAAPSPWFDCEHAGAYLGCAPGTLKTWRARGEGPPYHVINGKLVRYHRDELDAFVRGEVAR
jgi:hypothetical protein